MVEEYYPNKLKPKKYHHVLKTVCESVRKGHRREQAFIRAGVSTHTMYNWLRHYREEVEAGMEDTVLIRFWTEVLQAEAEAEADIVEILRNCALEGNIKAGMYVLDKRYKWSGKQEVELSAKDDNKIEIEVKTMTDDLKESEEEVYEDGNRDDSNTAEVSE